mgnify:FL=1
MSKFKIGDKVEVVEKYDNNEVGKVGIITSISVGSNPYYRINGGTWGAPDYFFKKVEDTIYEDRWHLNDGKVEIPGDADKLEKDGSVVAFRYRKAKPFQFGDKVKHKNGKIYVVVGKDQPGLYRIIQENSIYSGTAFEGNLTKVNHD